MEKHETAKYASVFPPPVGNQIKSTISLSIDFLLTIELKD